MTSRRDRRIDALADHLWSAGIVAYRQSPSPGLPARLVIPLERAAPPLMVWPNSQPSWTFFQVAPESVDGREQELVGLIQAFGPRTAAMAA